MKYIKAMAIVLPLALIALDANAAGGLTGMVTGGTTLIKSLMKLLTSLAALVGGWFVISGIIAWKKSSNDHSGQIDFKSVVVPIIAGIILVSFTGFILLTSETFGFATPNTKDF